MAAARFARLLLTVAARFVRLLLTVATRFARLRRAWDRTAALGIATAALATAAKPW